MRTECEGVVISTKWEQLKEKEREGTSVENSCERIEG